jgi:pimeloyl-ACP methyl ester carboxylesterase
MEAQIIKLTDGRNLVYAEYGHPDGLPLIFLHGRPGSHIQPSWSLEPLNKTGLRMIVPSRPGYSYSDPKPGYTMLDYTDDIIELADRLSLQRFGIAGVSGGGPYALACAAKIAHRLSVVGVISSPAPPSEEELKTMPSSAEFEANNRSFVERSLNDSERMLDEWIASVPKVDRLGAELHRSWFGITFQEAFRQGIAGFLADFESRSQGWRFALDSIKTRVHLWHGEDDLVVPITNAYRISADVSDCVETYLPNTGHLIPDEDFIAILSSLKKLIEVA